MASRKNGSLFLLFIIMLLLGQCKPKQEENVRLITFQGSEISRYPNFSIYFSELDSGEYGSIITHNGDWVLAEDFLFSIRENLPDTLSFRYEDSLMYINGDLAAISISKNSPPLSFFHQLSPEKISLIRTLQFADHIQDSIKPYLQKIALINPEVDIVYDSGIDSAILLNQDLLWVSQYFHPRALFIGNETDSTSLAIMSNFPYLETLFVAAPTDGDAYLPNLPKLKEIMVNNNEEASSIRAGLFIENPELERLTIIDFGRGIEDVPSWSNLKKLRSLNIYSDSMALYDLFGYHPDLNFLYLEFNAEGTSISNLFKKNNLKSLSLYLDQPKIGENLKILRDSFPELEYLEFENDDSLLDYSKFKNFENLKYLVVSNKVGLDSTLHHLEGLRYLSLPLDYLEDSVAVKKLQVDLPNTIITPNSGVCLGSGWLLLLLPIAGLWFYFSLASKSQVSND